MKKLVFVFALLLASQFGFSQEDFKTDVKKVIQMSGSNATMDAAKKQVLAMIPSDKQTEFLKEFDVIINVQGDEPLIESSMINNLMIPFKEEPNLKMATLKYRLNSMEDVDNPNIVKVITDKNDYALYFSRSPIPFPRNLNENIYFKHIGVYAYKRDFVLEFSKMPQTILEKSESLEQLRVLENGNKIKVIETTHKVLGVDTPEDLLKVINYVKENNIDLK